MKDTQIRELLQGQTITFRWVTHYDGDLGQYEAADVPHAICAPNEFTYAEAMPRLERLAKTRTEVENVDGPVDIILEF